MKTVILRKVTDNPSIVDEANKENIKPVGAGGSLVTLSQLKNVKLRKAASKKTPPGRNLSASKRRNLRKSSGGVKK